MTARRAVVQMAVAAGLCAVSLTVLVILDLRPAGAVDIPNPVGWVVDKGQEAAGCKSAPVPASPAGGWAGLFHTDPPANPAPAGVDPFTDPNYSITDVYGTGGLTVSVYDACSANPFDMLVAGGGTFSANIANSGVTLWLQAAQGLYDTVRDRDWVQTLDAPLVAMSDAVAARPFPILFAVGGAIAGFAIVNGRRGGSLSHAGRSAAWFLAAAVCAAVVLFSSLKAARFLDDVVQFGNDRAQAVAGDGSGPTKAIGTVHEQVAYRAWSMQMFGSADSPIARDYGPRMFRDQANSWEEEARSQADPAYAKALLEAKQNDWKQAAAEIQTKDPRAYQFLQGKNAIERAAYAWLDVYVVAMSQVLTIVALVMWIRQRLATRYALIAIPIIAPFALKWESRKRLKDVWTKGVGWFVDTIIVTIGAVGLALFNGALIGAPNVPLWLRAVLITLMTFGVWAMLGSHIIGGSKIRKLLGKILDYEVVKQATKAGVREGHRDEPIPAVAGGGDGGIPDGLDDPVDDEEDLPPFSGYTAGPVYTRAGGRAVAPPRPAELGAGGAPSLDPGPPGAGWEPGGERIHVDEPAHEEPAADRRREWVRTAAYTPAGAAPRPAKSAPTGEGGVPSGVIDMEPRRDWGGATVYVPRRLREERTDREGVP